MIPSRFLRPNRTKNTSSATGTSKPGCSGSPQEEVRWGCGLAWISLSHRDSLASGNRRNANLRLVAEYHHHVRTNDARCDYRDSCKFAGDDGTADNPLQSLRSRGVAGEDFSGGGESGGWGDFYP